MPLAGPVQVILSTLLGLLENLSMGLQSEQAISLELPVCHKFRGTCIREKPTEKVEPRVVNREIKRERERTKQYLSP